MQSGISSVDIAYSPDVGSRLLDRKPNVPGVRQHPTGIGAYGILHSGVETVVNVGQDDVEAGLPLFSGCQPVFLHAPNQVRAKIQELAQGFGFVFSPRFIEAARSKGYEFVRIDKLLNVEAYA